MLIDNLSLKSVLVSFESTLKIEYTDSATTKQLLDDAISRIESTYNVSITKDIFTLQAENKLLADTLSLLLRDIQECLKQMTLYTSLCMFSNSIGISLTSVNYLGWARNNFMCALKYLQNKDMYAKRADTITKFTAALDNTPVCQIKRLFVIMLMLERLGIAEGVAIVAQYLYLGGFNL